MRSAVVAAAFVAGALAVPYKRDVVTDVDVVTATVYQTVWAGEEPATSAPAPAPTSTVSVQQNQQAHYGHHGHGSTSTWSSAWTSTTAWTVEASAQSSAPAPSSSTEAPAPSSYEAPATSAAPAPSTYEAPATSAAPAPSTYAAPAPSSSQAASSYDTPSSSDSVPKPSSTDLQPMALYHHNLHRANHSSPSVEWDDELAGWAQQIADSCKYAHDQTVGDGNYGQNIAAGVDQVSNVITDMWYNSEVNMYNATNPQTGEEYTWEQWGHFSQVVWTGTTHIGCAMKTCGTLQNVGGNIPPVFTVCNYKSAGNVAGEYNSNVLKSLDQPTILGTLGL